MRFAVLCSALLLTGTPAWADTLLHLSESATVQAAPDEIAASLRAEAVSSSAADAQNKVNAAIGSALELARGTAGISASTGLYNVWRTTQGSQDRTERWQASQGLALTGKQVAPMLKLVGELQQKGLVVGQLGPRLSEEAERKAHETATAEALKRVQQRVQEIAGQLGLRFDHFKDVRLDGGPAPMPRMAFAQAAVAGSAPPNVQQNELPVTATANVDAVLVSQ
jgi:predicted secreted protein